MKPTFKLTNSTYSGYHLLYNRISYISKIGYSNKLKEYYFDIGYESREFSKFTISFPEEQLAEEKRAKILMDLNQFLDS